jgi:WD40 repeat protein
MTEPREKVDPAKAEVAREFKHTRPLTSCHWEPQSRYIFFGAEDNLVHRFDLATDTVAPFALHDSWVRGLASSPDGETLYTAGFDGRLVFWPAAAETPSPLRVIQGHDGWIRAVAASPCGRYVATCGNDRLVKLWDVADGRLLEEYSGHQWHVYNVTFLPDSTRIISCDLKGVVWQWQVGSSESRELATVEQLHEYDTTFRADIGGARGIAIRPDGGVVALGGITNVTNAFAGVGEIAIALVRTETGEIDRILESKEKTKGTIWGVAYHPDGFWIGVSGGGGGGWLHYWDGESDHEFAKVKLPHDGRGMSLAPDHRRLAVAHADMHLRVYQF